MNTVCDKCQKLLVMGGARVEGGLQQNFRGKGKGLPRTGHEGTEGE